jgi:hypothetical protein
MCPGIRSCIRPNSNRTAKICWNKRINPERNRIQRMIGHRQINRAIATRFDKLARSSLDALHIAAIRRCYAMQLCKQGLALTCSE